MSLNITSPFSALSFGTSINLTANDGVTPYTYSLAPTGIGGSIQPLQDGSVTYTAPKTLSNPIDCIDEIIVTDAEENTASVKLIIGDYLTIFCDILAHELDLYGRVFIEDQKFNWPKDSRMFVTVGELGPRSYGNNVKYGTINNVFSEIKTTTTSAIMSVNIFSRSTEARERKEEVQMALASTYSRNQQTRNGISIGTMAPMQSIPEIDGSAVLYRFHADVGIFYSKQIIKPVDYFDSFQIAEKINA